MKFERINFQPFQVLTAKNLNDLQDALEEAIPDDVKAGAFQINVSIVEGDGSVFYGIPDQPYSAIIEAIKSEQIVQCLLIFNISDDYQLKFMGQLIGSFKQEQEIVLFKIDKTGVMLLTDGDQTSDIIVMIGQDAGETLAVGMALSNSTIDFVYSDSSYTTYDPNDIDNNHTINIPLIDSTLKKSNHAADAKIVGDRIAQINKQLTDILGGVTEAELNTLKELSDALNDDANFAATVTNQLANAATKQELTSTYEDAIAYADNLIGNIDVKPDIKVYQITTDETDFNEIIKLLPNVTIYSGDVMIVTNSSGIKSAYQYDKEWIACDGNVDASKVIMPSNITLAGSYSRVGNLTKTTTGTAVFKTKGKSVAATLQEILSKREQPAITSYPAVSFNSVTTGSYEVGTTITPSWDVSLSSGSYTYGPPTGITASAWTITASNGDSSVASSGKFTSLMIDDNTSYSITAKGTYGQGALAYDNLGDPSDPSIMILKGSASATSNTIAGYRSWFMYIGTDNTTTVNSSFIRSNATNKGSGSAASTQNQVTIPAGTKRIVIALPQKYGKTLTSVIDVDGMGLDVIGNFTKSAKAIEGYNKYQATPYNVWIAENTNGLAATRYNFIIE